MSREPLSTGSDPAKSLLEALLGEQVTETTGIVEKMRAALYFHYETGPGEHGQILSAEAHMLEDIHVTMDEAEAAGESKLGALHSMLDEILTAHADDIVSAKREGTWNN